MRKIEQDEHSYYSNNKLNLAFIADNSKDIGDIECRSLAGSISERESISSISRIASKANSIPGSPFLLFEPEISSMDEWAKDTPNIFGKKDPNYNDFRKRQAKNLIPEQTILQMLQDDKQLEKLSKCTKKRIIGQKNSNSNKIITIQPTSFNQYQLRSKAKIGGNGQGGGGTENDSSSEEIRQIVAEMGGKKGVPVTRGAKKMMMGQ